MVILEEQNNNTMDLDTSEPPQVSKVMKNAIERGDLDAISALITRGASVNMVEVDSDSGSQHSILILAISINKYDVAKLLLQQGADVDTIFMNFDKVNKCIYEVTALKIGRMIYEVSLDNQLGEILHHIEESIKKCQGREPKVVPPKSLPDDIPPQVIFDAVTEGDLFSVKLLVNHGMNINTIHEDETGSQVSMLISAIALWHVKVAKFLIDRGAEVGTVFQNYNEDSGKVYEVTALSIANERHRESRKDGMDEIVDAIEKRLRNTKGVTPKTIVSPNVPSDMKHQGGKHSKISAWLQKPVPRITVDEASDIEEIGSNMSNEDETTSINGNAKKYTEDEHAKDNDSKQNQANGKQNNTKLANDNNNNTAKDSKMCVIL